MSDPGGFGTNLPVADVRVSMVSSHRSLPIRTLNDSDFGMQHDVEQPRVSSPAMSTSQLFSSAQTQMNSRGLEEASGVSSPMGSLMTPSDATATPFIPATKKNPRILSTGSMRSPRSSPLSKRRVRDNLQSYQENHRSRSLSVTDAASYLPISPRSASGRRLLLDSSAKARSRDAQRVNDSMVYLDGPQVYTCAQCRTHLTSHDDIISKSFHGRHGRAYLFDQCVNVTIGPSDDRRLITGLHTVCDIFCKRCKTLVGWTYLKAYEASQKYKEGKYIIEKINLHMEESEYYDVAHPAGERMDRWRRRSMSWGDDAGASTGTSAASTLLNRERASSVSSMVYEYQPSDTTVSPHGGSSG